MSPSREWWAATPSWLTKAFEGAAEHRMVRRLRPLSRLLKAAAMWSNPQTAGLISEAFLPPEGAVPSDVRDVDSGACPLCGGRVERGLISALSARRLIPPRVWSEDAPAEWSESGWCVDCGTSLGRRLPRRAEGDLAPVEPWR